ncbi:MAG: penicillin acylase family protein, partial [Deltaproteobacteria bacterium]|nr:penicillin acylase family protein [Deltaproteobacteria bacterium]
MRTWSVTAALLAMWVLSACSGGGEGGGGGTDTAAPGDVDAGGADGAPRPDAGEDATAPEDGMPPDTAEPARCLGELAAGQTVPFDGLDGPVEIVVDAWGVPHVYASTEADLFRAEGFIVAKNRIVSMHAMRRIASGAWAASPAAGPGDLANDVYMRILGLRRTAEEIWALTQAEDPEVAAMLTAFSEGVNRYIDAANAGTLQPPLEWFVIGAVEPWTPVDSLTIGRL